ncbi:Uncharacterised protein [Oligella ureolytica]|uniref:P-loop NTPase fold protein n=1 Tax=Oligella ureolytica TaxID=90244 RepID=UPI000DFD1A59|nr:P-loop NTPase fold protein [Oligella ureolytica]SUA59306.1 Uncharacterised protein [Oligella ureolytica]
MRLKYKVKNYYCCFFSKVKDFIFCTLSLIKNIFICLSCKEKSEIEDKPIEYANDYAKKLSESLDGLLDLNKETGMVVSLRGPWGVGKTYFWNSYVKNKKGATKYITVSLFGKNNIDDIKKEILLKSSALHKTLDIFDRLKIGSFFKGVDLASLVSLLDKDVFKNIIICFDDFERMSQNLNLSEVLGFIVELKEQHSCKILIINNNEVLKEQDGLHHKKYFSKGSWTEERLRISQTNNHEIFEKYSEKIIDVQLSYEPHLKSIFTFLHIDHKNKNYLDWDLLELLFGSISDSNKKFNIRLINSLILKLELLKDVLADETIRDKLKQAVITKVFLSVVKESISDDIKSLNLIYPNLSAGFYIDLVNKHSFDIDALRDALNHAEKELAKREQDELLTLERNESRDNINRIYFKYMYDMSYTKKEFFCEFYQALKSSSNIVELIGIDSFYFYINDFLMSLDPENEFEYKDFYIQCIKLHLDKKYTEINNLDFLTNYSFKDNNLTEELNNYFVGLKEQNNTYCLSSKKKIQDIITHLLHSSSWPKQHEIDLAAVSETDHENWLRTDREYFEAVFDFMRWVNNFSGDKPFKEFYDKTCSIYLKVSQESEHKHRLSFILKRLGLSIEQEKND